MVNNKLTEVNYSSFGDAVKKIRVMTFSGNSNMIEVDQRIIDNNPEYKAYLEQLSSENND